MPKFSPLQWVLVTVFLAFYGFAVFAVTRDYYIRHPVRPSAGLPGQGTPPGHPQGAAPTQPSTLGAASAIPPAITETNPELLLAQAEGLFGEQRFREAIPVYRRVIELVPADTETRNNLGLALFYAGDTAAALETLRQGTQVAPQFQRIWLTLGFVTLQSGDKPKAREALQRARDLGADNPIGQEAARLLTKSQD